MATYLVTGANRGIGYEYCRQLQSRGDCVIAVCRNASEELKQLGVQVEERVDITSNASVASLRNRLNAEVLKDNLKKKKWGQNVVFCPQETQK